MMNEQWRDVVGYEGYYQVSDQGRVRSIDRVGMDRRGGPRKLKGKILSLVPINRVGHLSVSLYMEGNRRVVTVHRLVAEAWIGPCPDGQEVCHGPNGVMDNSVSNLSYGTRSDNLYDRRRDGTDGGRCVRRSDGKEYASIAVAAEDIGCCRQNIWKVCTGNRSRAGGYGWEYVCLE